MQSMSTKKTAERYSSHLRNVPHAETMAPKVIKIIPPPSNLVQVVI